MKSLEKFYRSFVSAWDMVMDIPLPCRREDEYYDAEGFSSAAMIPVVGLFPGVLLAALGMFCRGSIGGSVIWAFAAFVVMEAVNSGRGERFVAEKISALIFKNDSRSFVPSVVTLIMLFKLAALFIVCFSRNTGFITLLFVLVFAFQMYCATFPESQAIIAVEPDEKRWLYVFPAVMIFLWFWGYPAIVLLSLAAVAATAWFFRTKVWQDKAVLNGDDVTLAAGFLEVFILICAIVFQGI